MTCCCSCPKTQPPASGGKKLLWIGGVAAGLVLWGLIYSQLSFWAEKAAALFSLEGRAHEALAFFLYDAPKVVMLLALVIFIMGLVRSFFSPERMRAFLAGKREGFGNVIAAFAGIPIPSCSCSAVPMFIGFVSAGVPLGVTFSFLIAAPMVNEVALVLLFGLVGWKIALAYMAFGLGIAIVAGWIIGRLNLENWLEAWVREARAEPPPPTANMDAVGRIKEGLRAVRAIVGKVWLWMVCGIAAGAFIHGYVPAELLSEIMGKDVWWSVPASVLVGIPMYSNPAGTVPIVGALLGKGAALGATLAFMMSVTALSLPEAIILRRVLSLRLIAVYFSIVGAGILAVGYLFNMM